MTLYSPSLFAHVAGAVLFFAALTLDGVALRGLCRAAAISRSRTGPARPGGGRRAGGLAGQCGPVPANRRADSQRQPWRRKYEFYFQPFDIKLLDS
jgi:hypothetical protein